MAVDPLVCDTPPIETEELLSPLVKLATSEVTSVATGTSTVIVLPPSLIVPVAEGDAKEKAVIVFVLEEAVTVTEVALEAVPEPTELTARSFKL